MASSLPPRLASPIKAELSLGERAGDRQCVCLDLRERQRALREAEELRERRRGKRTRTTELASSSISWCLVGAAAPARRVWLGLSARLLGRLWRTHSVGLGELRGDVRTCEYGDVHVMWGMLGGADDAEWLHGGSSGSGGPSATVSMAAAAAGKKQRRRKAAAAGKKLRRRKATADAAAWSRLFSTCCAF